MKIHSTNPARNYELIGSVEAATEHDIMEAVTLARSTQPTWASLSQIERNRAVNSLVSNFKQHDEEIAVLVSKEMGMPITRSRGQVANACTYFEAYMNIAEAALTPEIVFENDTQRHIQTYEPLGVVACITPWNFPLLNVAWQAGQALLAGNTILYKPSEETILFAQLLKTIIADSELPEGVFTVLLGDASVGAYLAQQPLDALIFTGSTKTGKSILRSTAKTSTRVLTEMGGSAPAIVFEDADIPKIIETIYAMRYGNSGQLCDGLKRLIIHKSKLDEVISRLTELNASKIVGNSLVEITDIGPLVSARQLELLMAQVKDALEKGAKVVFGADRPSILQGAYYLPTLLTNITIDMRVWREEVFGPVLPLVTFATEAEAIRLANDTSYGLGGFVFTEDKDRYFRVARKLQSGIIAHNNALFYSPHSPFGGYKESGNSRTNGITGFHEVTQSKLICEEK